jgi:hypothetical protein
VFSPANIGPAIMAAANEGILLRLVNAGIENHALQLLGGYFDLLAEDGKRAPTLRSQHTTLLPAGKTKDVLFQPDTNGLYTLFDRRLRTVNDTARTGGMFAQIQIGTCADCVDFSTEITESFSAAQDLDSIFEVLYGGAGIRLEGNTWRRTVGGYTITPNTVLEFTYESTAVGEIQGIGFDTDTGPSQNRTFRLAGTQNWGINDFVYNTGSGPQSFTIPVGQYFQGTNMNLILVNDHDGGVADSDGTFSNVRIFEAPPPPSPPVIVNPGLQTTREGTNESVSVLASDVNGDAIIFSAAGLPAGLSIAPDGTISGIPSAAGTSVVTVTVDDGNSGTDSATFNWTVVPPCADCIDFSAVTTESFGGGQDVDSNFTVLTAGAGIRLAGNTWRRTLDSYTVTPNTVLEFTYENTAVGEIQGIGFDADAAVSSNRIFKLIGTQTWGITDFVYNGSGPQDFTINVGGFYQGTGMNLILVNDHDVAAPDSNGTYSNVRIFEQ